MEYPTRVRIITGEAVGLIGPYEARTPEESRPHIGKEGLAEETPSEITITLDDGTVLLGSECWWEPLP